MGAKGDAESDVARHVVEERDELQAEMLRRAEAARFARVTVSDVIAEVPKIMGK